MSWKENSRKYPFKKWIKNAFNFSSRAAAALILKKSFFAILLFFILLLFFLLYLFPFFLFSMLCIYLFIFCCCSSRVNESLCLVLIIAVVVSLSLRFILKYFSRCYLHLCDVSSGDNNLNEWLYLLALNCILLIASPAASVYFIWDTASHFSLTRFLDCLLNARKLKIDLKIEELFFLAEGDDMM